MITSKFQQIAKQIQQKIDQGEYTDRIPSEQELIQIFSTTNNTIRKALDQLERKGSIKKVPYVGTFVNRLERKRVRIAWAENTFPEFFSQLLKEKARKHFDEFDLEFIAPSENFSSDHFDLMRLSATTAISYSSSTVPLSLEIIRQYQNSDYFSAPFDIHRINNFYHALPMLFSPSLVMFNQTMLEEFNPNIGAYDLNWEMLPRIGAYAQKKHLKLWNLYMATGMLRCLIFLSGDSSGRLELVDLKRLRKNIAKIWPLLSPELIAIDKNQSANLIDWTCRQVLARTPLSPDHRLAAFPSEQPGGKPLSRMAGEFFLCTSSSKVQAEAIRVAQYFLSKEIQELIGKHRIGLPILKSAALDSIDSSNYRDDLFLNESRHSLTNNAAEQEFLQRLNSFSQSIYREEMSQEQFMNHLEYEITMARQRNCGQDKLLNQSIFELAGL